MAIRVDASGNAMGYEADFASDMPTFTGTLYSVLDTGKRKIGETGKTWSQVLYATVDTPPGIKRTLVRDSSSTLTAVFQEILSYTPSSHLSIQGWIDISNMGEGDLVVVEISLNSKVHSVIQYMNTQIMPILHVESIIVGSGDIYKVRMKQTMGTSRTVSYKFFTEE